jgi:hypothetical protein
MNREQAFWQEYRLSCAQCGLDPAAELRNLEQAHILGQRYFREHLRIPGSLGSLVGLFLLGNPGTRRVGPLTPQAVPEDLRALLK